MKKILIVLAATLLLGSCCSNGRCRNVQTKETGRIQLVENVDLIYIYKVDGVEYLANIRGGIVKLEKN